MGGGGRAAPTLAFRAAIVAGRQVRGTTGDGNDERTPNRSEEHLRRILLGLSACAMTFCAAPILLDFRFGFGRHTGRWSAILHLCSLQRRHEGVIRASFHYTPRREAPSPTRWFSPIRPPRSRSFKIWAADAYNTTLGGALALRIAELSDDAGRDMDHPADGAADYGVSPGQEVILHFALTVPPNAIPGDHVGGIEALDVSPQHGNGSGTRIIVHEGIGVPIFINVPGPRHPSAAVTLVKAASSVPPFAFITGSSRGQDRVPDREHWQHHSEGHRSCLGHELSSVRP